MMKRAVIAAVVSLWIGILGIGAQTPAGFEITTDLAGKASGEISHRGDECGGWSLDAVIEYYAPVPRIVVRGRYVTQQDFDPASHLSYRIFDDEGAVLLAEGRRANWVQIDEGGLQAVFEIDIPQVHDLPTLNEMRIQFDAAVEHQFWYREKYPEMPFPDIRIINLPARDYFEPEWVWVPRLLPAGFGARIPVQFGLRPLESGGGEFVPALDVNTVDDFERVPSQRVAPTEPLGRQFRGWMPLNAHAPGTVMVRPGMVWEDVRWYQADDWFPRRAVTFVSPILYTIVVGIFLAALSWAGIGIAKIRRNGIRRGAWVGWGVFAAWFGAQMLMSGFWLVAGFLVLIALVFRSNQGTSEARTYASTWLYFVFVELYWTRLESSVGTVTSGVWFSAAVWALLLAPLLAIRRDTVRQVIALSLTAGWSGLTFVSVVYFNFFEDYPSVENLIYAGQVGELGDSISTLIQQPHVLLLVIWVFAVVGACGSNLQRKTQIENT